MIGLIDGCKLKINNIAIVKRTFEGINDDPIRSKYYTSKKYAVKYDIEGWEHNPSVHCFVTKKDAGHFIEQLRLTHIVDE